MTELYQSASTNFWFAVPAGHIAIIVFKSVWVCAGASRCSWLRQHWASHQAIAATMRRAAPVAKPSRSPLLLLRPRRLCRCGHNQRSGAHPIHVRRLQKAGAIRSRRLRNSSRSGTERQGLQRNAICARSFEASVDVSRCRVSACA